MCTHLPKGSVDSIMLTDLFKALEDILSNIIRDDVLLRISLGYPVAKSEHVQL